MHAKSARTDLHEAAFSGNAERVQWLLEQGQDPGEKSKHGQTALHRASMNGNIKCAKILIEYGAQTDVQDHTGCTPLHYAAGNGHLVFVKWLTREEGVALTPETNKERTPRTMARKNGHRKVVQFLAEMENKQAGFTWLGSS